jgi:hypothetical protein
MSEKKLNDLMERLSERGRVNVEDDECANESSIKPLEKLPRDKKKQAQQAKLPLWPMATRGVPNPILRSALFSVVARGPRRHFDGVEIPSAGSSLKIKYTGMRLDQADLDVWEQCLSLAKDNGLGMHIEFSANSFLQSIGRGIGNSQHDWLKRSLIRLNSALVEIKEGDLAYFGTLIQDGFRDEGKGNYIINLNPRLSKLYGKNQWTRIQWDQRHALRKKSTAQWLHGYYSSHQSPFPIKVETIHWMCGSETAELWKFRQSLGIALKHLQAATGWKCWIDKFDKVNVARHSE